MGLALPKLRWLIIGAVAAGAWVVREDFQRPRPPERLPSWIERVVSPKPEATKSGTSVAKADRPVEKKPAAGVASERPVPPKPVAGKPVQQKVPPTKTAIVLPKAVERPPAKPQQIATGSISRPDRPTFVQTTARVRLRAQARTDAAVIATLEPRTVMRELARTGDWRLVMGDGRKGWVKSGYLAAPTFLPRRPKLPVAEVKQAKSGTSEAR